MDELDQGRGIDVLASAIARGMRRQQHEEGSKPLTTARDDVRRYLVDQSDFAVQTLANALIHGYQVIANQGADIFYFH